MNKSVYFLAELRKFDFHTKIYNKHDKINTHRQKYNNLQYK